MQRLRILVPRWVSWPALIALFVFVGVPSSESHVADHPAIAQTNSQPTCPPPLINGRLGTGSSDYPSASGTQTGRLSRDGVASACAAPKACAVGVSTGLRAYDAYTFRNASATAACVTVTLTVPQQLGANYQANSYRNSFDPQNICANYLGDPGASSATLSTPLVYSHTVPAGETFVVVVHTTNVGEIGGAYQLKVEGLSNCSGNPQPQLSAALSKPEACVGAGSALNASFTVTNGSLNAQPVTATATLPPALLALAGSCTVSGGTCAIGNAGTVNFSGTLNGGQSVTVNYRVQIADGAAKDAELCVNTSAAFGSGAPVTTTACVTVTCEPLGAGAALPANYAGDGQRPGSVLIFPFFTSSGASPQSQNTRLSLTNLDPGRSALVHLFFVDGDTCLVADSFLCLTPQQTTSFLASDLDPGITGFVVAVAVGDNGCPIHFNALIGDAAVKMTSGHTALLGAEAVPALAGGLPACAPGAVTAALKFDGISYAALPHVLAVSNLPSRADGNETLLVVDRIGGNLGTGVAGSGSLAGLIFDDVENAQSLRLNLSCQYWNPSFPAGATSRPEGLIPAGRSGWAKFYGNNDDALLGVVINTNPNVSAQTGAFTQGRSLHKLSYTNSAVLTMPVSPPNC